MRIPCCVLAAPVLLLAATATQADVLWDESIDGELSGDRLAPTAFVLGLGSSELLGSVVAGNLDYVALTVPASMQLAEIFLVSYVSTDSLAFIGVQQGATFTEPAIGTDPANLLGWTHIGPFGSPQGTDILPDIGMGAGSQGFVPPLPAGTYTFWIQQTGAALTSYHLDFIVVPEPSAWLLAVVGSLIVAIAMGRGRMTR